MNPDPYVYPGTNVLINKFDIRDQDTLIKYERLLSLAAAREPLQPPPTMTPEGFCRCHRQLFSKIYDWAGEYRQCQLRLPMEDFGTSVEFQSGHLIRPEMRRVFAELKEDNYLRGLDRDTFSYRAAVYLEDLNFIHPFRDGNGRTQRLFLEHLGHQAGHQIDITEIDREEWMEGAKQSFREPVDGNHERMTSVIRKSIIGPAEDHDHYNGEDP